MKQLPPMQLEDGTIIYMEVQEDIEIFSEAKLEEEEEASRDSLGKSSK